MISVVIHLVLSLSFYRADVIPQGTNLTVGTVLAIEGSVTVTPVAGPQVYTVSMSIAGVCLTPVSLTASQFRSLVLWKCLRQERLRIQQQVFHTSDKAHTTQRVGQKFCWRSTYVHLREGSRGTERSIQTHISNFAPVSIAAGTFQDQNQSVVI